MTKQKFLGSTTPPADYPAGEDELERTINVLGDIKQEMSELMKKHGQLEHQMEEEKKKSEADTKNMFLQFIQVLDSFEEIFKTIEPELASASPQARNWVETFWAVYKMLQRALYAQNITPIETVPGEKVNPYRHNIVEVVEKPGWEDQTIVEVLRKGYRWDGKPLRGVDVMVVKNS